MAMALSFGNFTVGVIERARDAWHAVKAFTAKVFMGPQDMRQAAELVPQARQVAAVEFVRRLIKRERPVVQATWRMCPSI